MTSVDVEEQLESALAADESERRYFIRQALQLLEDDREDAPQLHAIRDHVKRALETEGDAAVEWLRQALAMLAEYRVTGDLHDLPDADATDDAVSISALATDPSVIRAHYSETPVTVEVSERVATAISYRLGFRAGPDTTLTTRDVQDVAVEYAVAREEFVVGSDGRPLVEWLEAEAGLQVDSGQDVECQDDSSRRESDASPLGDER